MHLQSTHMSVRCTSSPLTCLLMHQERAIFEKPSARASKKWADVDNKENSGQYSFFSASISKYFSSLSSYAADRLANPFRDIVRADWMLVYAQQSVQGDQGGAKWIDITQQNAKGARNWFPEEGGPEWFVDPKKVKPTSRKAHPAGKVYVVVIFMLFGTASISHSRSTALLREQTHPPGIDVDKNAALLPPLARLR